MRREKHVRRVPQWIVLGQRLRIRHVETRRTQFALLESLHEGGLVDNLPARHVGEHARVVRQNRELGGGNKFRCRGAVGGSPELASSKGVFTALPLSFSQFSILTPNPSSTDRTEADKKRIPDSR